MIVSPADSISCITCMQQGEEGGNNKGHESPGKIRLDGIVSGEPYGGTGGRPWDDGMYHGVREITVASNLCIESIRLAYDKDGVLVNGDKHGGDTGSVYPRVSFNKIKLDYPDEFLVSVSGNYFEAPWLACNRRHPVVIRSLKFESNRRTFGPFGIEVGTPFSFTVEDGGQIVGMKGRSGLSLDAIGFHTTHAPKRKLLSRVKENLRASPTTLPKTHTHTNNPKFSSPTTQTQNPFPVPTKKPTKNRRNYRYETHYYAVGHTRARAGQGGNDRRAWQRLKRQAHYTTKKGPTGLGGRIRTEHVMHTTRKTIIYNAQSAPLKKIYDVKKHVVKDLCHSRRSFVRRKRHYKHVVKDIFVRRKRGS